MADDIKARIKASQDSLKARVGGEESGVVNRCGGSDYKLRFQLITEDGTPLHQMPYRVHECGVVPDDLHICSGQTDAQGMTQVVSYIEGEAISLSISWSRLTVSKP